MDRKKLLVAGGLICVCLVSIFIFRLFDLNLVSKINDPSLDYNVYNTSFNDPTPELTVASTAIINFKTFVNGITPVAIYHYVSYEMNWHLFKKDNSYEKGTYSLSDDNIQQ